MLHRYLLEVEDAERKRREKQKKTKEKKDEDDADGGRRYSTGEISPTSTHCFPSLSLSLSLFAFWPAAIKTISARRYFCATTTTTPKKKPPKKRAEFISPSGDMVMPRAINNRRYRLPFIWRPGRFFILFYFFHWLRFGFIFFGCSVLLLLLVFFYLFFFFFFFPSLATIY